MCDRPGECSSEKNCCWQLTFRKTEQKTSSESSEQCLLVADVILVWSVESDSNGNLLETYTSLSANTIMISPTNRFQRTRLLTSSTDKHYSLDSGDDFRSGCQNVSHQQQFFPELHSPGRLHNTNYTIEFIRKIMCAA